MFLACFWWKNHGFYKFTTPKFPIIKTTVIGLNRSFWYTWEHRNSKFSSTMLMTSHLENLNPSFWSISQHRYSKFSSTRVKICPVKKLTKFYILEYFWTSKFKIFFNHGEDVPLETCWNPSFWSISEHQNSKFSSTMVKMSHQKLVEILHSGEFQKIQILNFPQSWWRDVHQ